VGGKTPPLAEVALGGTAKAKDCPEHQNLLFLFSAFGEQIACRGLMRRNCGRQNPAASLAVALGGTAKANGLP
jgi:hypothetical protein